MKKYILLVFAAIFTCMNISGKEIKAYLLYSSFNAPGKGPYIETYISVIGSSVNYVKTDAGKFQGAIEVSMLFKAGEEIKAVKKYNLLSPEIDDTSGVRPNFLDLQRIPLDAGTYSFEISIADKNKPGTPFTGTQLISINYNNDYVGLSDIQLVESYSKSTNPNVLTKSGYDLIPYVSTFYPSNMDKISFYAEIYNSSKILGENEKFVVTYYIEGFETKAKLNDFNTFSKQTTATVNPIIASFPVNKLPSGNYNLVIEVKDKLNNSITSKKVFFQRSNPKTNFDIKDLAAIDVANTFASKINDRDSLLDFIKSLRPISDPLERTFADNQVKSKEVLLMQQYLYNFWVIREPLNPEKGFNDYNREVAKANKMFGTKVLKGYDTERGRVYLQYGPPDSRYESTPEPSAYPYEIWQYYKMGPKHNSQTNKKFVFYNPDLVTNSYTLIHSDAQGEPREPNWQIRLHKRNTNSIDMEQKSAPDHFGNQSIDQFNNPR